MLMSPSHRSLEKLTVVVTGAAQGIGRAVAQRLAECGCSVVAADLSFEPPARTGGESRPREGEIATRHVDVRSESSVVELFGWLARTGAPLDGLVHCAGTACFKSLLELSFAEWTQMIETNLTGAFLCSREAARQMRGRGGRIVQLGSVAAYQALPGNTGYGASKAGVRMLTQVLNQELASSGTQATLLQLGAVNTSLWQNSSLAAAGAARGFEPIEPREVADLVVDVLSRPARLRIDELRVLPGGGVL